MGDLTRQQQWDRFLARLAEHDKDKVWRGRADSQVIVDDKENSRVVGEMLIATYEMWGNDYVAAYSRLRSALRAMSGHEDPDDWRVPGASPKP